MRSTLARRLARFGDTASVAFTVVFADGTTYRNRPGPATFTLRFLRVGAEWRTLAFGHIGLLDSHFDGDVDIEGDLAAMFAMGMATGFDQANPLVALRNRWHELTRNNRSWARAKSNARFHYGIGYDFYRLWLDTPLMMYTCAYWEPGVRTLEEAQRAKVEHVCRKIRLRPGETVIDIGCGFGGFMFHAAEHHGAHVTGIDTTTEQVEALRGRVSASPHAARLELIETDFRDVFRQFDKVVSIGTLEHAGRDQLKAVVSAHAGYLKPGGLGVLHFIGHVGVADTEFFIREHVFPGGWIPSLAETIAAMEACGLEVLDIENLRRHYALTLDAWAERFDRNWPRIHAMDPERFNERFRRIWRTYLIACAEMFRSPAGRTHLFQITYSRGNVTADTYPMSRGFLYSAPPSAGGSTVRSASQRTVLPESLIDDPALSKPSHEKHGCRTA